jgi:hypothetical protein
VRYTATAREKAYTVEGPFVLERKGRYYQMFSGGNWKGSTYGVSYATSDRLDAPGEWQQSADGLAARWANRSIGAWQLGPGFDPSSFQQFRLRKEAGRLTIAWESTLLGEIDVPDGPTRVGLYACGPMVAFDMVRVSALGPA